MSFINQCKIFFLILLSLLAHIRGNESEFKKMICPKNVIRENSVPFFGSYNPVRADSDEVKSVARYALRRIIGDERLPFVVFNVKSAAARITDDGTKGCKKAIFTIGGGTSFFFEFVYNYDRFTNGIRCCAEVANNKSFLGWKVLRDYECIPNKRDSSPKNKSKNGSRLYY